MSDYLIPTSDEMIDKVARSMVKEKMFNEVIVLSNVKQNSLIPTSISLDNIIDQTIDHVLNEFWYNTAEDAENVKKDLRQFAIAAINTINLELMIGD